MGDYKPLDQTEFNSNKASLIRVDELIKIGYRATYEDDIHLRFKTLQNLRKEALYKMVSKDKKPLKDREDDIELYNKLRSKYEFWARHKGNIRIAQQIDRLLDDYDIFLRDFLGRKGMLLRDDEDLGL